MDAYTAGRITGDVLSVGVPGLLAASGACRFTRWVRSTPAQRAHRRLAARVRRSWPRLAVNLGLVQVDRCVPSSGDALKDLPGLNLGRRGRPLGVRVPSVNVVPDAHGVIVDARTLPGVGLAEYAKAGPYLADAWGCRTVEVRRLSPQRVRLRGLVGDPLAQSYTLRPSGRPAEFTGLHVGRDEYGREVTISLENVSGITIGGLPGYGKTSLVAYWLAQLMPSASAQFAILDGKGGADYDDFRDRAFLVADDDIDAANVAFKYLYELMRARQQAIKAVRGTANAWMHGPDQGWPLIVIIVDESHTYVQTSRKQHKTTAEENAWYLEQLAKKCRSVAMLLILITQKQTGDAIPTAVRDVCQFAMTYACKTDDAAVSALGADIRAHPEASPVRLVGPEHVGIAVASLPNQPGFSRIRTPYVDATDVACIAAASAVFRRDPAGLLKNLITPAVSPSTDTDSAA